MLFICCAGSSLLPRLFSSCDEQGLLSSCGTWTFHCSGFSRRKKLVEQRLQVHRRFSSCSSWAPEHRLRSCEQLSCSEIRGIILDQGSNPYLLHWQVDSLPLNHQGSPQIHYYPFHLEVPGFSMGSVFHYNLQNLWAFWKWIQMYIQWPLLLSWYFVMLLVTGWNCY